MSLTIRQNFHEETEAANNKQINMELRASYVYQSMVVILSSFFFRILCQIQNSTLLKILLFFSQLFYSLRVKILLIFGRVFWCPFLIKCFQFLVLNWKGLLFWPWRHRLARLQQILQAQLGRGARARRKAYEVNNLVTDFCFQIQSCVY